MRKADADVENLSMSNICWYCRTAISMVMFCPLCHKIQPPHNIDPFVQLAIKPMFSLDISLFQKQYFSAQHLVHPDRYLQASKQEQSYAQQQAEAINAAYQHLKDPVKRAETLLGYVGLSIQAQTPKILATMMEWQEKIAEAKTTTDLEQLLEAIATSYRNVYIQLEKAFKTNINSAPELAGELLYLTKIQQQLLQKIHRD